MIVLAKIDAPPLLKSKPEIIEDALVGIKAAAIGSKYSDQMRREIQNISKLCLALPDLLFRMLTFGDICRTTYELHQVPRCVQDRMADSLDVFHRAARKKDS